VRGNEAWVRGNQLNPHAAGLLVLAVGILLGVCAVLWGRYAIGLQERAARMMGRGDSDAIHRFTRGFGVVFLSCCALASFLIGLAHAI
jgi:mannose/fructose/N-acetylgalactosamine-specific phosphotransferase system component IIC